MGTDDTRRDRTLLHAGGFLLATGLCIVASILPASSAQAAIGYEPDAVNPQIGFTAQFPYGVAIDQASQRIYVAIALSSLSSGGNGEILQFNADGTPTSDSPFGSGTSTFFTGVAVNPLNQDVYAARGLLSSPLGGLVGEARMHHFSSATSPISSFTLSNPVVSSPQIAIDSAGHIYYPNASSQLVEVLDSGGTVLSTISCGGCPGGAFQEPSSVAIDADDNVYVADLDRDYAVKLKPASQSYAFERLFQSGRGSGSIAVDPVSGDVFVGDLPDGKNYHVVAYDSAGNQFDDFAAGMVPDPPSESGRLLTAQMAINSTTRDLYVAAQKKLLVFERTTIAPPAVATDPASSVGQLKATINATVNAHGHAILDCEFEYTDHADFLANVFTNATAVPCPTNPNTANPTPLAVSLSGLAPGTTYHFRSAATSNGGSTLGGEQTFATLPLAAPTVSAQVATGIAQTRATLTGKVNPKGGTVSDCHFEYGTTTSYGIEAPCATLPTHVNEDVPQNRIVTGLTAGATYHYRLAITTNAGTTKGIDSTFATTAAPTPSDPTPPSDPGLPPASPVGSLLPSPATSPTSASPRRLRCRKGFVKKKVRGKRRCVRKLTRKAARKRRAAARKRARARARR
jgi:hypothetical protein